MLQCVCPHITKRTVVEILFHVWIVCVSFELFYTILQISPLLVSWKSSRIALWYQEQWPQSSEWNEFEFLKLSYIQVMVLHICLNIDITNHVSSPVIIWEKILSSIFSYKSKSVNAGVVLWFYISQSIYFISICTQVLVAKFFR